MQVVLDGGFLGFEAWRLNKRGAGAAAATIGLAPDNPLSLSNAEKAQERQQGEQAKKDAEKKNAR